MSAVDRHQLWQNALGELQIQMRPEDFRTWFRNTSVEKFDGTTCVIGVENPFNLDWLATKCTLLVSRTLESLLGTQVRVEFVVGHATPADEPPLTLSAPASGRTSRRTGRRPVVSEKPQAMSPRYTFDTFVVGSHNELAHAASMRVAMEPGQKHNP